MLKFLALTFASAFLFSLASCGGVVLRQPLSDEATSVLDERLCGEWIPAVERDPSRQDTYFIGRKEDARNSLQVVWVAMDAKVIGTWSIEAFTTAGANRYLSVIAREKDRSPMILAFKYEMPDDDTLWLSPIDRDFVSRAIADRRLIGHVGTAGRDDHPNVAGTDKPKLTPTVAPRPWERPGSYDVELTDSPEKIVAFLDAHTADCFPHASQEVFIRVPRLSVRQPAR